MADFWEVLSDEVGTAFWESEIKQWKLFKSKVDNRKDFRKWFQATLRSKQMPWLLRNGIFHLLAIFWGTTLKPFFGKGGKSD